MPIRDGGSSLKIGVSAAPPVSRTSPLDVEMPAVSDDRTSDSDGCDSNSDSAGDGSKMHSPVDVKHARDHGSSHPIAVDSFAGGKGDDSPGSGDNLGKRASIRRVIVHSVDVGFGNKWTKEEDERLMQAVSSFGTKAWGEVARAVSELRTETQCMHRWNKVLKPGLVKGSWTKEEDDIVRGMVAMFGGTGGNVKWSVIASRLPGRVGKQCRERWFNHLDPDIKKGTWTLEEDRTIFEAQRRLGNKWCEIAKLLPGRSENAVKNRWNSSARKRWPKEFGTSSNHSIAGLPTVRRSADAGGVRPAAAPSSFSPDVLQQYVSNLTAFSRALQIAGLDAGSSSTLTDSVVSALSAALVSVGLLPTSTAGMPLTPAQVMFSKLLMSLPNCPSAPSSTSAVTADQVRALLAWHSKMIGMLHKGMEPLKSGAAPASDARDEERAVLTGVSPTTSDALFRDPALTHSPVTVPPVSNKSVQQDGFFGFDFASPWAVGPGNNFFNPPPSLNGMPASYAFDGSFPFSSTDFQAPMLDMNLDDNADLPSLSATFNTGSPFLFGTPTSPTAVKLAMNTWSPSRFVSGEELSFASPPRDGWQKTFADPPVAVSMLVDPPAPAPAAPLPPIDPRPAPPRALSLAVPPSRSGGAEPWEIMASPLAVAGTSITGSDSPVDLEMLLPRNQLKTMTLHDSPSVTPDVDVENSASSGSFAARRAAKGKALPPPLDGILPPTVPSGPPSGSALAGVPSLAESAPMPSPATDEVRSCCCLLPTPRACVSCDFERLLRSACRHYRHGWRRSQHRHQDLATRWAVSRHSR
jgi:hypothetical protein